VPTAEIDPQAESEAPDWFADTLEVAATPTSQSDSEPVQETRSEALERILKALSTDEILSSVIVNIDGLLVASYPLGNEDNPLENPTSSPQVAAMSATLVGLAEKTLYRLAQGQLQRLLIESQSGIILVYPAGRTFLAVLAVKNARLAQVLHATQVAAEEIVILFGD
jgi:predicted regulator of Ras-like GTPase activity (Roadblock/LC7/MglB family)